MIRFGLLLLAFALETTPALSMQENGYVDKQAPSDKIVRALEFFRLGNYDEARPLLSEIVRIEPRNIDTRMLLGESLMHLEQFQEARKQFQSVLSLAPGSIEAAERLKDAEFRLVQSQRRQTDQRRVELEVARQLAEKEKQLAEAANQFAEAERLIGRGDLVRAQLILEELKHTQPDMTVALQRLAEVYSANKQFRKAASEYQQLLNRSWHPDDSLLKLAQNLEWAGEYQRSARAYRQFLDKNPENNLARRNLANVNLWAGRYSDALVELQHIFRGNPQDVAALFSSAKAYEQLGDLTQELTSYEAILNLEPHNSEASEGQRSVILKLNEKLRSDAFAALDARDLDRSARLFRQYLDAYPDHDETALQLARIYSWNTRYPESRKYYSIYLDRVPADAEARRELARIEEWTENYDEAIRHYRYLLDLGAAVFTDYEGLINAHRYKADLAGAQIYAQMLEKLVPGNAVATSARAEFMAREAVLAAQKREAERLAHRNKADLVSATGRFIEAVDLYLSYIDHYGPDPRIELTIARLFAWAEQYDRAAEEFRIYQRKYPSDLTATLELAHIEEWSGHYDLAEKNYRRVLDDQPANVAALLGVAQVRDVRGDDPVRVLQGFRGVLSVDSTNEAALQRSSELRLVTSPQLLVSHDGSLDSDDLYRSRTSIATRFTLPGRVRISPQYNYGYFRQRRLLPQDSPALEALNTTIENLDGTVRAQGGSLGLEIGAPERTLRAAVGQTRYSVGSPQLEASIQADLHNSAGGTFALGFTREAGVNDLNTVASLLADVRTDRLDLRYEHPVTESFRFATMAGAGRYSSTASPDFESSTSRRAALYLNFSPSQSVSVGYAMRLTSFDKQSPLYFSPGMYQSHGLAYQLGRKFPGGSFISLAGEAGYGRIDGVGSVEFNVVPRFGWQIGKTLQFEAGFSFARSSTALFGTDYRSQSLKVQLRKTF